MWNETCEAAVKEQWQKNQLDQDTAETEAYRDGLSAHAKIFVSLAPSPVAMVLPQASWPFGGTEERK